ncbi:MAG TPA: AraC family transcriptional regulator [Planctomicrobium sp.]|nr:AraC family transcriptional regulator [Planctomicrobium sp.]
MAVCFDQLCLVEPSLPARRLLWHVLSVGCAWRDEPEVHPGRDKAGAFLFWVDAGNGKLTVDEKTWDLRADSVCWFIDLSTSRSYVPQPGQRLQTSGIRFSGPGLDTWQESLGGSGEFLFRDTTEGNLIRCKQQKIMELVAKRPKDYEWAIHECLTQVLGRLLIQRHVLTSTDEEQIPSPVTRVVEIVMRNPLKAWRAPELAKMSGVSYSQLRSLFREFQHKTLSDFLQETRLHQARLLLANEKLSMKDIARRLNFSSEFYFSQWFRRQTGFSPTMFRTSLRD